MGSETASLLSGGSPQNEPSKCTKQLIRNTIIASVIGVLLLCGFVYWLEYSMADD
ncbi:hypothetical protein KIPB_005169, partial [Kipferlia bialata]|eukprot:g5169.t1